MVGGASDLNARTPPPVGDLESGAGFQFRKNANQSLGDAKLLDDSADFVVFANLARQILIRTFGLARGNFSMKDRSIGLGSQTLGSDPSGLPDVHRARIGGGIGVGSFIGSRRPLLSWKEALTSFIRFPVQRTPLRPRRLFSERYSF